MSYQESAKNLSYVNKRLTKYDVDVLDSGYSLLAADRQ
jgi:hypothetical protein